MKLVRTFVFPLLMVLGLVVSTFVIVTSLQAASSSLNAPATMQTASSANSSELAAQGRALFVAKGCIVCHRHDALATERRSMAEFEFDDVPNLTKLKIDVGYLRKWLHDPQAVKSTTWMPNLELSESEIDALVAFLTTQGK